MGIAILACALVAGGGVAHAEVIDRVLAIVGGQLIMLSDVHAAQDLRLVTPAPSPDPIREVLSRLIDRELQLTDVERYAPPEPTADEVDRAVQTVRDRFPSPGAFEAVLARSGIDLDRLRERLREDLRIQAYLDQRFAMSGDRRQKLIDDWMARLRRSVTVIDLYLVGS